jgi:sulfate permease, SulP family
VTNSFLHPIWAKTPDDSFDDVEKRTADMTTDVAEAPKTGFRQRLSKIAVKKQDVIAALTGAIANTPDGMASGVLAGVNPVYGLYTLMVGMPVAALTAATTLMIFNTTSAMTLVAADSLGDRTGDDRVHALIVIALVAGIFQVALGLLDLGRLTKFVSNSVMTGFLTGVAVLIVLGQLWDLTGYSGPGSGNKVQKTAALLENLGDVNWRTCVIGFGSLAIMIVFSRGPLSNFNLLIALAIATVALELLGWDSVEQVKSLGEIPRSLPSFELPHLRLIPTMLAGGIAVGTVGVLQGAGVAQRYTNPGSSEPDDSRDFIGQGAGNAIGSLFQAMPGGGSLSGTALNVSAGATGRSSTIIQALFVVIIVLVFSSLLSLIPMASLAALLIYTASLSIKFSVISTVQATSLQSTFVMIATFIATLLIPLQNAVLLGIVLAGVLFVYKAAADVKLMQLRQVGEDIVETPAPEVLTSASVTVLEIYGSVFYAGARTLGAKLPTATNAQNAIVILRIRGYEDVGSTFLNVVQVYAERLRQNGGALLLAGVSEAVKRRMARTGHLDLIGEENVFVASEILGRSSRAALAAGEALLNEKLGTTG